MPENSRRLPDAVYAEVGEPWQYHVDGVHDFWLEAIADGATNRYIDNYVTIYKLRQGTGDRRRDEDELRQMAGRNLEIAGLNCFTDLTYGEIAEQVGSISKQRVPQVLKTTTRRVFEAGSPEFKERWKGRMGEFSQAKPRQMKSKQVNKEDSNSGVVGRFLELINEGVSIQEASHDLRLTEEQLRIVMHVLRKRPGVTVYRDEEGIRVD